MTKSFVIKTLMFGTLFFFLGSLLYADSADSLIYKEKIKRKGKIKIIKGFDPKTNRLITKEKYKNGKRIYFIEFNEKGKVERHINKKGVLKIHVPGCDC